MRTTSVLVVLAGLLAFAATPAWANGFRSYRVCGGDTFSTCAAVEITVTGTNVQMRVWNLSGNLPGTYGTASVAGSIINGIGFYNVPSGLQAVTGSLSMTGPARPGDTPGTWLLNNGGMNVFSVDYRVSGSTTALGNGIASGCATAAELPGSPPNLYMNPCNTDFTNSANWVVFNFQVNQAGWDPNSSEISMRIRDGATLTSNECWTGVSPGGRPANCVTVTPP